MAIVDSLYVAHEVPDEWELCQAHVRKLLSDSQFYTWIAPIQYLGFQNGLVRMGVSNELIRSWLEQYFKKILQDGFTQTGLGSVEIQFEVTGVEPSKDVSRPKILKADEVLRDIPHSRAEKKSLDTQFYLHYRFDEYVIGECNRLAHTVCTTVAQTPGRNQLNPLVIHGKTGLGKTHLLQAIGASAIENETAHGVLYRTAEQFLKDFMLHLVQNRDSRKFYEIYGKVEILLIDDIQILAHKDRVQEVLFQVLNQMIGSRRQIVISCDQLPAQVPGLSQRLLNRFEGGMTVSMDPPDMETRLAILHRKAQSMPGMAQLGEDVFRKLACQPAANVRELEGMLVRILAFHDLLGYELDPQTIMGLLGETTGIGSCRLVGLRDVAEATASHFNIKAELLSSSTRIKSVSLPRKVAMFLSREITDLSLQSIGLYFNRDYSTVIASIRSLEIMLGENQELAQQVDVLRQQLKP